MSAIETATVRGTVRSFEYGKTENLFKRSEETHKLTTDLRREEFKLISRWSVTEKIDGTNMRVLYDPRAGTVEVRGRSDNAQVHVDLLRAIEEMFPLEAMRRQFDEYLGEQVELGTTLTIYGEGYGAGIQKGGGNYNQRKTFRMFDVVYHRHHGLDSWAQWDTVEMIAAGLGVETAPFLGDMTLGEVVELVYSNPASQVAAEEGMGPEIPVMEGVVARTNPYLFNHQGQRVMFKLKGRDLQ